MTSDAAGGWIVGVVALGLQAEGHPVRFRAGVGADRRKTERFETRHGPTAHVSLEVVAIDDASVALADQVARGVARARSVFRDDSVHLLVVDVDEEQRRPVSGGQASDLLNRLRAEGADEMRARHGSDDLAVEVGGVTSQVN